MRKRSLLISVVVGLSLIGVTHPQQAPAQQAPEPARVGILGPGPPPSMPSALIASFRNELTNLGYSEGKNLIVEERWRLPSDKDEWLPQAIADLERANVQVIFAFGAIPARALKAAGTKIPSVFAMVIPTAEFVSNPEKPEGNMTGFTIFDPKLPHRQLELLKQVVPEAQRIAFLGDEVVGSAPFKPHEDAARSLGLEPIILKVRAPQPDLDGAFREMQRQRADALVVLLHPIIGVHRLKIGEYATKLRLPSLFAPGFADAGGLLTYGTEFTEAANHAAAYINRILKGAKPSELPTRIVLNHRLIVNLKTAQALSITVPSEVLNAAVEIIR
jgi:putative tryptophan/tyrosine transport system substrate-binding protein